MLSYEKLIVATPFPIVLGVSHRVLLSLQDHYKYLEPLAEPHIYSPAYLE